MTIKEFNAWLDGFSEAIGDAPTPDQWQKIKAKLQGVSDLGDISKWFQPQSERLSYGSPVATYGAAQIGKAS